ncbi:MAG: L,D-transpeptidase [Chloroflexi bacterium]|nr:L,D-transpeptidase [Chloroflexota bacterium]
MLSRRDFLKLSGAGLLGMFLPGGPGIIPQGQMAPDQFGRVADESISLYAEPSFSARKEQVYWRDFILPITGVAISEDETAYNRIWYEIGADGYAYSGSIQPVRTVVNQPAESLPAGGALVEVTVPYTDARRWPFEAARVSYRLYHETTHWADKVEEDPEGAVWYRLVDDKMETYYFVMARHARVVPPGDVAPLSPDVPSYLKRIVVHLNQQLVIAYERQKPVFMSRIASGSRYSSGNYSTPLGRHVTFHKRPSRHMAAGDLASDGFDLPGVPWVCYFTDTGVSFHGTYWHNDFGRPRSHGCINMSPQAAKWIYRWTEPFVLPEKPVAFGEFGTTVEVYED